MKHDYATPSEVAERALMLVDAVLEDSVDDVLYEAQELGKCIENLYKYQDSVRSGNCKAINETVEDGHRVRRLANAVQDAVDVGDYATAEDFLSQFRAAYDNMLMMRELAGRLSDSRYV
jgi:hypothetical protein